MKHFFALIKKKGQHIKSNFQDNTAIKNNYNFVYFLHIFHNNLGKYYALW